MHDTLSYPSTQTTLSVRRSEFSALAKVQKLFSLAAQTPNAHEARLARRKAAELMKVHDIKWQDLKGFLS